MKSLWVCAQSHDRDGNVLLAPNTVAVLETELVDSVNVIAQEADDPLEGTNVSVAVNLFLKVRYDGVLPLVRFLKCAFETGCLRPDVAAKVDIVVDFSF